jgi:antitoxin ParD1/3/4
MSTMNISLPDSLRDFVDQQVGTAGYGTSSEYVRELIRREQERHKLRGLLLAGAQAPITGEADARYFAGLRQRIEKQSAQPPALAKRSRKAA